MNTFIVRYTKTIVMLGSILAVTLLLLAISRTPATHAGPLDIVIEDFEDASGWVSNPGASDAIIEEGIELDVDTGTRGMWEIGDPQKTFYQVDSGSNGTSALITGLDAGSRAGEFDVDGGKVSILSPWMTVPEEHHLILIFDAYLAHSSNSSKDDYLRVSIISEDGTEGGLEPINDERFVGTNGTIRRGAWSTKAFRVDKYAGTNIRLLIEVVDGGNPSIVEAGIDNIRFGAPR